MEQNFQTSFIPKKPMVEDRTSPSRPVSLFVILAVFVLITMSIASAGLYFYKGVLSKKITKMDGDLNIAKNRFEPAKIAELEVLNKRLDAANQILEKHISITPIFKVLEEITMKSVRYNKFSYSFDNKVDSKVKVRMTGVAIGYRSVALQADLFTANKNLIDPVFSNLVLDDKGNVNFDLEFSVEPLFVNYKHNFLTTISEI